LFLRNIGITPRRKCVNSQNTTIRTASSLKPENLYKNLFCSFCFILLFT